MLTKSWQKFSESWVFFVVLFEFFPMMHSKIQYRRNCITQCYTISLTLLQISLLSLNSMNRTLVNCFIDFVVVLRSVAQVYGQVRTDWKQCFVIDCSLSHPAGHKPFTAFYVTRDSIFTPFVECVFLFAFQCMYFRSRGTVLGFFFVSSAVSELSSAWSTNRAWRQLQTSLSIG